MAAKFPTAKVSPQFSFSQARWLRWGMLSLSAVPLLVAFAYGYGLPMAEGDCLFQKTYGFFGPGCGLTRSFVAIAQGDLLRAVQFNLFGPLLFGLFAWGGCQAAWELAMGRALPPRWNLLGLCWRYPSRWAVGASAMLVYYVIRLFSAYGPLPGVLETSALWQFFRVGAQQL